MMNSEPAVPARPTELKLPNGVADLAEKIPCAERHPGLQLDKFSPPGNQKEQRQALDTVCDAKGSPGLLAALCQRRNTMLEHAGARRFRATTTGSLTLHLARASGLENAGINLHPIYGFACLPGSGLKGMARAYAETVWVADQGCPVAAWNETRSVFGWAVRSEKAKRWRPAGTDDADGSRAGAVVFHDAWPVEWPRLAADIVNNHHREYYDGDGDPGDWEEPNMVSFLSIDSGTAFDFAVSARAGTNDRLVQLACEWLQAALVHEGAGAKTNAGYGRFRLEELPRPAPPRSARRIFTHKLELVTPAFLAGAKQEKDDCDLRSATLRGLLRWWWRTMHAAHLDRTNLLLLETALWGDAQHGAALALSVQPEHTVDPRRFDKTRHRSETGLQYLTYGMDATKRGEREQRYFVDSGACWEVTLSARPGRLKRSRIGADDVFKQGQAALWLLCRYGGIGSKARKGFGSFADVEVEGITDVESCKDIATRLRRVAGLDGCRGSVATSSLDDMLQLEVSTPWRKPRVALNQLGGAIQSFARRIPQESKMALGLPRKNLPTHGHSRYAAPIHYHFAGEKDGTLTLRLTAFPSPKLPNLETSRTVLEELGIHVEHELETRKSKHADRGTQPPVSSVARGNGKSGRPDGPTASLPKSGDHVPATLLKEKTKKGGWRAKHEASGLEGPIQNTADVPAAAEAGQGVSLVVRYVNPQEIAFNWPSERGQAKAQPPGGPPRSGGRSSGKRQRPRKKRK